MSIKLPEFNPAPSNPLWALANYPKMGGHTYLCNEWLIAAANYIVQYSEFHCSYSEEDMIRTIYSAIVCDQAVFAFARNPDTNKIQPRGFATWAWLSPEMEKSYMFGGRKLQPFDYRQTSPEDVLWVIDLIAPFDSNDVRFLCNTLRDQLSPLCHKYNFKGIKAKRSYGKFSFFYAHKEVRS